MPRPQLAIVVNARSSRAKETIAPALAVLLEEGFDLRVRLPESPEEMRDLLRDTASDFDAVAVAGGDGTINAALPALIELGCPVGILPTGTANDFARTVGIPPDPVAAAHVIAGGHRRRVDVGRVNGHHFLNAASIGLAVRVAEHQQDGRKQEWGVLSYALTTLEALTEADRFHAVIDCGGTRHEVNAYQIAVGNGIFYGGGMRLAPDAEIDDGFLDVYAIESDSIADLVALAPAVRAGTHGDSPDVTTLRCQRLRIETDRPAPINTDGEVTTGTPAEFEVVNLGLEVIVPQ